ncbi:MAG: hypothetical protein ACRC1T_04800 [Clostridium chrysemydis]|uniref:hypothetical protein n=1 Tax=Clostridium chrysemydis TaxID=2665504 RepID=UPI003F2B1372
MKNNKIKLICGIGVNDYGKVSVKGKNIKSYVVWTSLIRRCYDSKFKEKCKAYDNVTICDEWLYFSNFKKWFDENYRWDLVEQGVTIDLDKDLLSDNCKIYSPETCIFIPHKINIFLTNNRTKNTSGYIGVHKRKNSDKYEVQIREFGTSKQKYLGLFKNIKDANDTYISARKIEADKAKKWLSKLGYNEKILEKIK